MGDTLSASDVMALTKDNGNFLEGNGIIILLLFLLFMGGGFGGFGGNSASVNGALTRAEMADGFNNQNTVNTLNNLGISINNGFNGLQVGLCNGFNSVNQNINNLGFAVQNSCCELKTAIHSEGEMTRGSIISILNNNTVQDLRDRLSDKDRELNSAIFAASQLTQTKTLEDFILANK